MSTSVINLCNKGRLLADLASFKKKKLKGTLTGSLGINTETSIVLAQPVRKYLRHLFQREGTWSPFSGNKINPAGIWTTCPIIFIFTETNSNILLLWQRKRLLLYAQFSSKRSHPVYISTFSSAVQHHNSMVLCSPCLHYFR